MFKCFPGGSAVKNLPANARDVGSIPGLGRSRGEGNGNPLQYSCLENPMDKGAWQATVHWVAGVRHNLETKPPPPLFFRFFPHVGHYRVLSRVPCAIQ